MGGGRGEWENTRGWCTYADGKKRIGAVDAKGRHILSVHIKRTGRRRVRRRRR